MVLSQCGMEMVLYSIYATKNISDYSVSLLPHWCFSLSLTYYSFGVYCMKWRRFINYIRPFVESFHGPYKNGMGYWFGVRVIVVVYIYIVYAYNISLMLFMQFLGLASLTLIQASVKPFRGPMLNHIDISCLSIVSPTAYYYIVY